MPRRPRCPPIRGEAHALCSEWVQAWSFARPGPRADQRGKGRDHDPHHAEHLDSAEHHHQFHEDPTHEAGESAARETQENAAQSGTAK